MANAAYRLLPDGSSYIQQVGNAGGPMAFKIQFDANAAAWYVMATTNFEYWWPNPNPTPYATMALAQTALNTYISELNGGTA